jgi:hypothetical protein
MTAAFAGERDAHLAMRLIAMSPEIVVGFTMRQVYGERGELQMVLLEATLADADQASRVETLMAGAHGVRIPSDDTVTPTAIAS